MESSFEIVLSLVVSVVLLVYLVYTLIRPEKF
jgi:K+-transporting ATPase KdpF subunit